jgi:DNA invertase Pin-like site-specific DNA recombinase
MPLAVLYARFSPRPNPDERDSVEKQLERCRAYCEGHGYTVVAQHHDKDVSGERADNRPGLQKAITAACDRKAVLCVYSLSRLPMHQGLTRLGRTAELRTIALTSSRCTYETITGSRPRRSMG